VRRALFAAVVLAALAPPGDAFGHAFARVDGDGILYWARDADNRSTLTITAHRDRVRFVDTTVYGGIDPGRCEPGQVDRSGFIVEVWCPRGAATRVRADLGPDDDSAQVREAEGAGPIATELLGGTGSDRLTGGAGSDAVDGGGGTDTLDGGAGDDELRGHDGGAEQVRCGAGSDRAIVDPVDVLDGSCEASEQRFGPPPPENATPPPSGGDPAADTKPPDLEGRATRRLRAGRALVVHARSSEGGRVRALATVRGGTRRMRFAPVNVAVVAGEETAVRMRPSRALARTMRRELARGRGLSLRVALVATDEAGNTSEIALPRIRVVK
jgi:hypothetical protein